MAGIEDFVKLWRGNSKLRSGMNFGENRGRYWTNKPDLARYWAQGGSQQQGRLIGDVLGKVKSLKIPKKIYERINPDDVWQTMIKDDNLLKKQKTDVLQTIMARSGSLSKLALKGLSVVASLPAQVAVMTLSPTDANADEVNMTLEDFAKLAEENQPKEEKTEKEMMAAGGNVPSTDIKDYYRRSWGIGDRQPFAPENKLRVAVSPFEKSTNQPIMVEESRVLDILNIEPHSTAKKTFYANKGRDKGNYNKLIQITGAPVKSTETVPGTQHKKTLYNVAPLLNADKKTINKEKVTWIINPHSRKVYADDEKGKFVTKDKNLRQLFIKYYNLGHGPQNILELIDPNNKLGINQQKYGAAVADQLINEGALTKRTTQSIEHKAYTDEAIKLNDLEIEKIAKVYDQNPKKALVKVAHALAGGEAEFNKLSSRLQTEMINKAGLRSFHLLKYLEGERPSVDKNTTYKIKNKDAILKTLQSNKHPFWDFIGAGTKRTYQYAELDSFFGDSPGTHEKARKDIHKFLKLNNAPQGAFVIDEGPAITTALKNGLPILARFSNLITKQGNTAKITLDVKLRTVYPILTNLDNGKDKYKITASDVKKSKVHNWGLKEKDIGKIINKKDHPAIKDYNKFSKEFSRDNKIKTPIFKFGDIGANLDLDDRRWVTKESAKELKNMNKKYGFYADNMGTDLKLIESRLKTFKKINFNNPQIVLMKMRDSLQKVYNKIPLKGVRLGASSAAAALDYSFFHYVMGIPSPTAAAGAALWFVKNPEKAQQLGYALMAVAGGEMEVDEFISKHGATLVGISSDAVLSESEPKERGPMVWKQGKLEIADEMARGGLSGVDQYILNRYK